MLRFFIVPVLLVILLGCQTRSGRPDGPPKKIPANLHKIPDATPRVEPLSRYGNRFKGGNTYVAKRKRYRVMHTSRGYKATGLASWYGTKFHGRRTSSGERYNMYAMTAAHPTLPLPTYARVTNLRNGKNIIVKINDRGPFRCNRLIDLSYAAAAKLGILGHGTGHVHVESVDPRDHGGLPPKRKMTSPRLLAKNNIIEKSPAPNNPAPKKQKIYLQLGSFSERANAENLVKKLGKISTSPAIIAKTLDLKPIQGKQSQGTQYQVRIGPFKNQQEAINLTQKLAQAKLPQPIVITE